MAGLPTNTKPDCGAPAPVADRRCRAEGAVRRLPTWPSCRDQEWTRRPGAVPPMRMIASWSRSPRIDRIQVCGAIERASGGLPSDHHADIHKLCSPQGLWISRPVDISTIGFADRLRFPRFPSKLEKRGNAHLRPHTHRPHSQPAKLISMGITHATPLLAPKAHGVAPLDTKSPIQVRGLKAHGSNATSPKPGCRPARPSTASTSRPSRWSARPKSWRLPPAMRG